MRVTEPCARPISRRARFRIPTSIGSISPIQKMIMLMVCTWNATAVDESPLRHHLFETANQCHVFLSRGTSSSLGERGLLCS